MCTWTSPLYAKPYSHLELRIVAVDGTIFSTKGEVPKRNQLPWVSKSCAICIHICGLHPLLYGFTIKYLGLER